MWGNGKEYEGGWLHGKQCGVGYYTNLQGVRRKGVWVDGKREKWIYE